MEVAASAYQDWEIGNRELFAATLAEAAEHLERFCMNPVTIDILPELRDMVGRGPRPHLTRLSQDTSAGMVDDLERRLCWRCVIAVDCKHTDVQRWTKGDTIDSPHGVLTLKASGSRCNGCGQFGI